VIGAGSSGLVAAKYLVAAGYDVAVFEKGAGIAGTFVTKCYDDAHLVSSKFLTAFSDLRSPESDPPHLSLPQYVEYLRNYADKFDLYPLITFGALVESVTRQEKGGYEVQLVPAETTADEAYPISETRPSATLRSATVRHFDAVCVCSGLHEAPYVPPIAGLESFAGERMLHSAEYKDSSAFEGKRVLVVGCGETGMDLAYRAVQVAAHTAISIKNGFLSVPHDGWGGVPLDTLISNLFEHAYEHWWCHKHHLKWKFTTGFIKVGFLLMTGSTAGYNQWVGGLKEVKRGHHILCKSTAAMPYINRPLKQAAWWYSWLWRWSEPQVDKSIHTYPAPALVDGRTVTFVDGQVLSGVDVIALATGYRQTFPFLHRGASVGDRPAPAPGGWRACTGARGLEDPLPEEHFVIAPDEPELAFIGFVRPNVGAIPPMAELQVMWWIQRLRGKTIAPIAPTSYGLLGKKLTYGVDYGNYMHQLAAEIGACPTVGDLARRSPRALIAWSLGQAYIPFFRLVGPYASDEAWAISADELYSPVARRGLFANSMLVGTMGLFAGINLLAHAVEISIGKAETVLRAMLGPLAPVLLRE